MKYKKKDFVEDFKRSSYNLAWEVQKRFNTLNKFNNEIYVFNRSLHDVITFKECEIIYQLPENTCHRDYKRGLFNVKHVRKSVNTFLITSKEAQKHYEDYWDKRAHKDQRHLYSGYDGKKMTEAEFLIRYGHDYIIVENEEIE